MKRKCTLLSCIEIMRAIVIFMRERETTDTITMPLLSVNMPVPDDRIHGRQHYVSQAIEKLRKFGFLRDVADRCEHCGRAKRTRKPVPLFLTDKGRTELP